MSDIELVDPELRATAEATPPFTLSVELLPMVREGLKAMVAAAPVPPGLLRPVERIIPGPADNPELRVLVFRPEATATEPRPAIVHLHGGGFVAGTADIMNVQNGIWADRLGCVIVSVDYRLSPDSHYPAALEDGYAALKWVFAEHAALGIDPARLGVAGESAGGGLAAALALYARDKGEVRLAFQYLNAPMIDDRTGSEPNPHPVTGRYVWTAESNRFGWESLLGQAPGGADVPAYAAPARATDLAGLPPTYLTIGALDLFLEEDLDYVRRLSRARVPVELRVYPGAFHGYEAAFEATVTKTAARDGIEALGRLMAKRT